MVAFKLQNQKTISWLLTIAITINFLGLLNPVWGVDATLYANIAKQMVIKNNYWELYANGPIG